MASYESSIKFDGKDYELRYFAYKLHRETDPKGNVSTGVLSAVLELFVESTEDTAILETVTNTPNKPFNGSITFPHSNQDGTMKELKWTNGYVVDYSEELDVTTAKPMGIRFKISAEKIDLGDSKLDRIWAKKS